MKKDMEGQYTRDYSLRTDVDSRFIEFNAPVTNNPLVFRYDGRQ